jgi:hypothetical protein
LPPIKGSLPVPNKAIALSLLRHLSMLSYPIAIGHALSSRKFQRRFVRSHLLKGWLVKFYQSTFFYLN